MTAEETSDSNSRHGSQHSGNAFFSGECPIYKSSLFSQCTYHWLNSYMWHVYKQGQVTFDQLWICAKSERAETCHQRFKQLWIREVESKGIEKASLFRTLYSFQRRQWLTASLVNILCITFAFATPMFLFRHILEYIGQEDSQLWYGIVFAGGLFLGCEVMRMLTFVTVWLIGFQLGIRSRAAVATLLFEKILKLRTLKNKSVGELVNLFSNDCQRIYDASSLGVHIVASPLMVLAATVYCLVYLGPWTLLGSATIVGFYPLQIWMSKLTAYYQRKTISATDMRVQKMTEILNCIKLIKLYAWEKFFAKAVYAIRDLERRKLSKLAYISTVSSSIGVVLPIMASICTFIGHTLSGNDLTAAQAFVVVAVYNVMSVKIGLLPYMVKAFSELRVSLNRIKKILIMEELNDTRALTQQTGPSKVDLAVQITNGMFAWDCVNSKSPTLATKDSATLTNSSALNANKTKRCVVSVVRTGKSLDDSKGKTGNTEVNGIENGESHALIEEGHTECDYILSNININVVKGKLYGVCGGVGSGKSALLSAVLGQMHTIQGQVCIRGRVSYVPQQSWIQNATLRDNILFGLPYDHDRYAQILQQCALTEDLERLPAADMTEIGERGINLSGGQKQRVSLARALYSDRDIYLLDDPLAAVDSHVGQHLFEHCLKAALKGKTVIFVTHQLQYLSHCDYVLMVKGGEIISEGSHCELMEHGGEYSALVTAYHNQTQEEAGTDDCLDCSPPPVLGAKCPSASGIISRTSSRTSLITPHQPQGNSKDVDAGKLMKVEPESKGSVMCATYKGYMQAAGGYVASALVLFSFILPKACAAANQWWLGYWIEQGSGNATYILQADNRTAADEEERISDNPNLYTYAMIYGLIAALVLVLQLLNRIFFIKATLRASTKIHDGVFKQLLACPISFFETTPMGHTLTRFTRDMDEIDVQMPFKCQNMLGSLCSVLSCLAVVAMVFPWMLVAMVPFGVLFVFLSKIFGVTLRETKRADNASRSPLFGHVATSIQGLQTIHAYGKQEDFLKKFQFHLDRNSVPLFLFNCCMRWLSFRMDVMVGVIIAITAVMVVVTKGDIPVAYAGLALVYTARMTGLFQFMVRQMSETEAHFTSVQRVMHYFENVPLENCCGVRSSKSPPADWPPEGAVSYQQYCMRYRDNLPWALRNITCDIQPKEKVGIVGRTGSGKSSLALSLFRLVEPSSGSIQIDGLCISDLDVHELRSRLSIIPQDPVLFAGTIRYNLDPLGVHTDEYLWNALSQCHVKGVVQNMEAQLEASVVENGDNFSVGERQLLCLARALLKHAKILVLDEATAAIDTETDALIQETIKDAFADCTILTIAHRLNTVLNCDRIIILDQGQIVESGDPRTLRENPGSRFHAMLLASDLWTSTLPLTS